MRFVLCCALAAMVWTVGNATKEIPESRETCRFMVGLFNDMDDDPKMTKTTCKFMVRAIETRVSV